MDKVHFPAASSGNHSECEHSDGDDEDYSASVTAIMQRRASSVRRSKKRHSGSRRGSSPFTPDILPEGENATGRRRSSVFTTSSGDTAITMEDSFTAPLTQEQIFENLKLHKEVLSSVKMQPWNMRKKLKLVMQAKAYIKKHEGALQERLAKSHSTKDMLARCNIYLVKKMQQLKREMANLSNWLIPWEHRIKEIESHFGSVVASYFIFLRWLFWVNIAISSLWVAFVAVPEMLTADYQSERKSILPEDKYNATNFLTLWDFEGVFKYSPMFYGWYTNVTANPHRTNANAKSANPSTAKTAAYHLPLAYFFTGVVVYIFSFVATLRKMAENSRMSKLSEKEDECIFSWKLFTGWDYMIGNAETAHNRVASIIMGFKEALLEEAEKKREAQSWKVIGSRILVNIGVLTLLGLSAFAVITVVARSNEKEANSTTWRRNEITVVMSLITLFFPIFFELLGYFEHYHPRKQLRLQLARIMVLNLLNLYSLIFALFGKISDMTHHLQSYKTCNDTLQMAPTTPTPDFNSSQCYTICDYCDAPLPLEIENLINDLITNLTEPVTSFQNSSQFNVTIDLVSSLYENVTDVLANALSNFDNSTFTLIADTEPYEIDFTPIRTAIEELFTTLLDIFDNSTDITTTSIPLRVSNSSSDITELIEESINTTLVSFFTTIMNATNTTTPMPFIDASGTDSFNESIGTSTIPSISGSIISKTVTKSRCHLHCEPIASNKNLTQSTLQAVASNLSITCLGKSIDKDYQTRSKLRSLCWETMFGQELVKLTIMDLVMTLLSILAIDFFRGLFVRYMNNCWCWDLEKKFPQYGDFKVAENILHLVNNQGMVWMGMFFSPGLVVINVVKLYIMMYLRSWAVLTCNVPHEVIFRASRSNNFYYALLLMMLFLCVLPVSYAIVWLEPSWHCGPFSGYQRIFHIFTKTLRRALPESMHKILDYIASPGIVIPLLMLLVLIIYYLISLSNALREANNDLKIQLRRERTEERRKMFQIADRRRRGGSDGSEHTPFGKWKKLLQGLPSNKSFDETPKESIENQTPPAVNVKVNEPKNTLSRFILRAIKSTKNEDNANKENDKEEDATDTEQHDSLPPDDNASAGAIADNGLRKVRKKFDFKKVTEKTIPVITISKTESSECILDKDESKPTQTGGDDVKIKIDVEQVQDNDSSRKPKIRYVLKKQTVVDVSDIKIKSKPQAKANFELKGKQENEIAPNQQQEQQENANKATESTNIQKEQTHTDKDNESSSSAPLKERDQSIDVGGEQEKQSDVGTKAKTVFQASSSSTNTTQTTDTHTESSTDYIDSTFSN